MKRPCSGYRDLLEVMFRDETKSTLKRVRRIEQRRIRPLTLLCSASTQKLSSETPETQMATHYSNHIYQQCGFFRTLSYPLEELAVCHFYQVMRESLPDTDHALYLHLQLPAVYAKSNSGSALRLATQAISYAISTKMGGNSAQLSRQCYAQAIVAIQAAVRDSFEVRSDQVLYAVLLLSGYEVSHRQLNILVILGISKCILTYVDES